MSKLSSLRQNYTRGKLLESEIPAAPIPLFEAWFKQAVGKVPEPNAMILSTVDENHTPYARTVLLKELSASGFTFYSNYESRKGQHIMNNNKVSLLFLWQEMERQVIINGQAQKVDRATSTAYFHSRPRASQIGAWTSRQSTLLENRSALDQLEIEITKKYKDIDPIPVPPHWGGYIVSPDSIEFWQGRPSRLHDRLIYTLKDQVWNINRLAP